MSLPNDVTTELEMMIDRHGLLHVLTGLSLICSEKADHIRASYDDKALARAWRSESNRIEQIARRVAV